MVVEPDAAQAAALNAFLADQLYAFNQQQTGYTDGPYFQGVLKDDAGQIIADPRGHAQLAYVKALQPLHAPVRKE